jgi:nucleoside-diphosphate-sugar epimerase
VAPTSFLAAALFFGRDQRPRPRGAARHPLAPDAPKGVAGRNSDNTMIKRILGWEPATPFRDGLAKTYAWIAQQYADRKAGRRTVHDSIRRTAT